MVTQLRVFFGGPLFVVVGVVFVARVSLHHQSVRNGVYSRVNGVKILHLAWEGCMEWRPVATRLSVNP